MGEHKPRAIAGEYRASPIDRCRARAFTSRGLVAELAELGLQVDYRSVWIFVHEEGLSYKKDVGRQRARPARCRRPTLPLAEA